MTEQTTLELSEEIAQRAHATADRTGRALADVVADWVARGAERAVETVETPNPNAVRSYSAKLYATARAYWASVRDADRLALTDDQLDDQFWCIDPEGIPRLKSDQGHITLPPDGLGAYLESIWQANPDGEIEEQIDYRAILNQDFPNYLMRRIQHNDDQSHSD